MSNIIIDFSMAEREKNRTTDSKKYNKDCYDFVSLEDGTIVGECRYCNLSTKCRQIDLLADGTVVPMEANFLPIYDALGRIVAHELFCTGHHDLRPLKERIEDNKVS